MHVDIMKICTRVKAPKHTITTDVMTFQARVAKEVEDWLNDHHIWDYELLGFDDGDHGPPYAYYFVNKQDAVMFALRWA